MNTLRAALDAEYAGIVTAGTRARWVPVLELLEHNFSRILEYLQY